MDVDEAAQQPAHVAVDVRRRELPLGEGCRKVAVLKELQDKVDLLAVLGDVQHLHHVRVLRPPPVARQPA